MEWWTGGGIGVHNVHCVHGVHNVIFKLKL